MKSVLCYSLFAFFMTVAAYPIYVPREANDLRTRGLDVWKNKDLLRRYPEDEYSIGERDLEEDTTLSARYLGSSYGMTEREYQELEERQGAASKIAIQLAEKVAIQGIEMSVSAVKDQIAKDKKMRGEWTSLMVNQLAQKYPHHNFVVCHVQHHYEFKGTRGVDWGHSHQELNVGFHKTVGFEIYWFQEGTFHRTGDGGYLNWAYIGNVINTSSDGKDVTFGKP